MPAELVLRLTGGVQNTDPAFSVGGETSAWPVPLGALFPDVSAADCAEGLTDYRALDLLNLGDQGSRRGRFWTEPMGALGLALSDLADVASLQGLRAPWDHGAFLAFESRGPAQPLELPDIPQGGALRLWLRRQTQERSAGGLASAALRISYL